MRTKLLWLTALAALGLAAGCTYDAGYETDYVSEPGYAGGAGGAPTGTWGDPGPYPGSVELEIGGAFMEGSLGDAREFAEEPYDVQGLRDPSLDVVRFDATDSRSGMWVMAQVEVVGGLDHEALAPGASLDFPGEPVSGLYVGGVGCSGPSPGNYTYDSSPQSVHVEVQTGSRPGYRRFELQLDFGIGHVADVVFEVPPSGAALDDLEARVVSATIGGGLEGGTVDGVATYLADLHAGGHSTVIVERLDPATGETLRARLDVEGGLAALGPGTYELGTDDFLRLSASTTPFEVDPGYSARATHLVVDVTESGSARSMDVLADLDSGDVLWTTLVYELR